MNAYDETQPGAYDAGVLQILEYASYLKDLKRQGWVDRGIAEPESVADHSYRLALAVMLLAANRPEIDTGRAMTLALVHDLPEALAGDATPFDDLLAKKDVDREQIFRQQPIFSEAAHDAKKSAEAAALEQILGGAPQVLIELIRDAWLEYEAGETPEAKLVRQADKIETLLQAVEYAERQPGLVIDSFRIGTDSAIDDQELRRLLQLISDRESPSS